MVAIEPTAEAHRVAREEYEWEVIEAEPDVDPDAFVEDEQSLDYFNRHVAGDR